MYPDANQHLLNGNSRYDPALGFTPNGPVDLVAPSPVPLPHLDALLERLQRGEFDLTPVEALALRYIMQERDNAKFRTQEPARLYRVFSSAQLAGQYGVGAYGTVGAAALTAAAGPVTVLNHVVPDWWVVRLGSSSANNQVQVTQMGADIIDLFVTNIPTRIAFPGLDPSIVISNFGTGSVIWTVAAVIGYDPVNIL